MNSVPPRQQLLEAIDSLSDRQVVLLLQLIQTFAESPAPPSTDEPLDPLAKFVGATTHGQLAGAIDETLYGRFNFG